MTGLDAVLLHGALLLFAGSAVAGLLAARSGRPRLLQLARGAMFAGAALLVLLLIREGSATGRFPITSRTDTQIFVAALLALLALSIDLLRGLPVFTVGAAPLAGMTLIIAISVGAPAQGEAPPGSAWIGLHVLATLVSYGLFELAFVAGVLYLVEQRQLKTGGGASLLGIMPSLETLYRMLVGTLASGVALLLVGIVSGYLYARSVGMAAGWRTDPKIIVTTLTWAAYVAVLALSLAPAFKGRRTAMTSVVCFVVVMGAMWASSFWTGFHRYS